MHLKCLAPSANPLEIEPLSMAEGLYRACSPVCLCSQQHSAVYLALLIWGLGGKGEKGGGGRGVPWSLAMMHLSCKSMIMQNVCSTTLVWRLHQNPNYYCSKFSHIVQHTAGNLISYLYSILNDNVSFTRRYDGSGHVIECHLIVQIRDELAAPSKPSSQSTGQKINGLIFSPGSSTRK